MFPEDATEGKPDPSNTVASVISDNDSDVDIQSSDEEAPEDEENVNNNEETTGQTDLDQVTYTPAVPSTHEEEPRYPTRERASVQRYGHEEAHAAHHVETHGSVLPGEPTPNSYSEAMQSVHAEEWTDAIQKEQQALFGQNTWTAVTPPRGARVLDSRMVFLKKLKPDRSVERYKARLVVKGYQQRDVSFVYAPVIDFTTVRVAVAALMSQGGVMHQLDVKTAFLNGELDDGECIYIRPPAGMTLGLGPGQALKLNKALFGLKRVPKIWNQTWDRAVKKLCFTQFRSDECVYSIVAKGARLWLLLYVDDILLYSETVEAIEFVKKKLMGAFKMRDLGRVKQFLGVEFVHSAQGLFLVQRRYVREVLRRYGMPESKAVATPMIRDEKVQDVQQYIHRSANEYKEVIGSLLYLSTRTRPDITAAVGHLARHSSNPTDQHWVAIKRVLRYLSGTQEVGMYFRRGDGIPKPLEMRAFSDADWAGNLDDRKSTSGAVISLEGTAVVWHSKKQGSVALSSSEAEYIALSECVKEVKWLRSLLSEFGLLADGPTVVFEDNTGTLKWATSGKRAKHVDIRYHFVRDMARKNVITLQYCPTKKMIADIMTKSMTKDRYRDLRNQLGLRVAPNDPRQGGNDTAYM